MGQKPGTRLANPAQEQPWKMLAVELKMEQPAAQALVYVSFVAMLHTGAREAEQEQSCKEGFKTAWQISSHSNLFMQMASCKLLKLSPTFS